MVVEQWHKVFKMAHSIALHVPYVSVYTWCSGEVFNDSVYVYIYICVWACHGLPCL